MLYFNCSQAVWRYSTIRTGFNTVTLSILYYFSINLHFVGLQETRYTGIKCFRGNYNYTEV